MSQLKDHRPIQSPLDPNLTILPSLRAPIDEGPVIPYPRRSWWSVLLAAIVLAGMAVVGLGFAFFRANAFG